MTPTPPPATHASVWTSRNLLIGCAGIGLILAGWWLTQRQSTSKQSTATAPTSCRAVSHVSDASIDQAKSKQLGTVDIAYTLTNTIDTKLNCFLLATVKDTKGVQVGTWRRSFFHSAPGTYRENHDIGKIKYMPGETLTLQIIAADANQQFVD